MPLQIIFLLAQLLLDFTSRPALLALSRWHIMAGQPPEASKQSAIIRTAPCLAEHNRFRGDTRLKDAAPTPQILQRHPHALRDLKFCGAVTAQTSTSTGKSSHENLLHGKLLRFSDQHVTGLMHGDPPQTTRAPRQGLRENVTSHSLPTGCINTESNESATHKHHDPCR